MSVPIEDIETMWVLIPHEVNDDGEIVYRKCRVKKLVQKGYHWRDEIEAMYADFVWKTREGLVTLNKVDIANGKGK